MFWGEIVAPAISRRIANRSRPKAELSGVQDFTRRHGLSYDDTTVDFGRYQRFCRFREGQEWAVEHAMAGTWKGMSVAAGDFWTKTQFTAVDDPPSRNNSSIVIGHVALSVPHLDIWKRHWSDKVMEPIDKLSRPINRLFERADPGYSETMMAAAGSGLGAMRLRHGEIELGGPEFHSLFGVTTEQPELASRLVDTAMMQWLMGPGAEFSFELLGPHLLVYCKRRKPEDLAPLFDAATGFRDHIPAQIWSDYPVTE